MGLKRLKWEFEQLTNKEGTAANARAFLVSIQLSSYGYDFRTISSWSECVDNIRARLIEIEKEKEIAVEIEEEKTELEEQIIKKYNTLSLTWFLIKKYHNIKSKKDLKLFKRFISLWLHPDLNKDRKANQYMAVFNNIFDILKTRLKN